MGKATQITSGKKSRAGVPPATPGVSPVVAHKHVRGRNALVTGGTPAPLLLLEGGTPVVLAAICVLLALSVAAVYGPVVGHQFVNFDDLGYIIQNPYARAGLTWEGVAWAFRSDYAANWHPLTWLSHMLDCQLFGLRAGGHHVTSVLMHIANTLILFLLLRRMTGALWRSALVAALFGLHPLHVESVAWVSERKDVLCTLFGLLSIWAYGKYAEQSKVAGVSSVECRGEDHGTAFTASRVLHSNPSRATHPPANSTASRDDVGMVGTAEGGRITYHASRPSIFYLLSLIFFALGLMSKPMLVTLPFILLLLDYWPLNRMASDEWRMTQEPANHPSRITHHASCITRLLLEKLPFLALSAASCIITFLAQQHSGAVADAGNVPLPHRWPNAVVSYVAYLGKLFWPTKLAVYYPYRETLPAVTTILCLLVLIIISVVALTSARRRPWLAMGWLWYLGTLVPVIGLVQVGLQSMADRYTYLPAVGIFIMLAWAVRSPKSAVECRVSTLRSAATEDGASIEGKATESGVTHHASRITHHPIFPTAAALVILAACMGLSSAQVRVWKDSETLYRHALTVTKDNAIIHGNLGSALIERGRLEEAAEQFAEALRIKPRYAEAQGNWGFALALQGKLDEAINHYHKALEMKPTLERTHFTLGQALLMQGKRDEAIAEYRTALEINPDWPAAANDLAWILATDADEHIRDGAKALELAERACRLTGLRETLFVGTLAAAYAEAGDFKKAVSTAEKARDLAAARGQPELVKRNEELLELYRAGKPYHEPARP